VNPNNIIDENIASTRPTAKKRHLLGIYDMAIASVNSAQNLNYPSPKAVAAAFKAGGHGPPEFARFAFIARVERLIAVGIGLLQLLGILLS
jgi:hypothetical protein